MGRDWPQTTAEENLQSARRTHYGKCVQVRKSPAVVRPV